MCLIDLKKAGETLIIFDEIQECPEALNTLKYFKENANEYHVIAAGSLLGTLLAQPKSYPVGMVNLLDIHPLNFEEFLDAVEPALYAYYDNVQKNQQIEEIFHNRLLEAYNNCLIIGGMPKCVASWIIVKEAGRVTSKRQSNGLFLPVCSIVYIMYQRWSILCPPSTDSINLNCKGPLTENYVLQQLKGQFEVEPRYFSDKNGEIDFVIQYGTEIIPVETKGGEDKSAPSFKRYIAKNQPEYAIRFSKRGYRKDGDFTNIPVYLACKTKELL